MVKMSVESPNEAAGCQRFSSGQAQSNYARAAKHGPAALHHRTRFSRHWLTPALFEGAGSKSGKEALSLRFESKYAK
jgi:hypothetical protein